MKRSVAKVGTLDHAIMAIYTHLRGITSNGEACENNFQRLREDLSNALELVEDELKYTPANCFL
jgi:hypothetical protein